MGQGDPRIQRGIPHPDAQHLLRQLPLSRGVRVELDGNESVRHSELGHGQAVLFGILSGEVSFVWRVYGSVPSVRDIRIDYYIGQVDMKL
jgi:hypothetical protein